MKVDSVHDKMVRGIDTTTPPHLVDEFRWIKALNTVTRYGKMSQIPRKVLYGTFPSGGEVQNIVNLPTGIRNEALIVALAQSTAFQVRPTTISSSPKLKDAAGADVSFTSPSGVYRRWATTIYNRQLWFTNEFNSLQYTSGAAVGAYSTSLPSARYLENWFDHLVCGWVSYEGEVRPTTVMFSDLYRPDTWNAAIENEAALIDLEEFCAADMPLLGVTGLAKMNDRLVIYTPTAIIGVNYVGLPKVVQWAPISTECGNGFMYGLASHKGMHFFFDPVEQDFMQLSAEGLKAVGGPILTHFLNTLTSVYDDMQKTWAFVRPEQYEVWWVYCGLGSSTFNQAIFYNWRTSEWGHSSSADQVASFGGYGQRAFTIGEAGTGQVGTETGIVFDMGISGDTVMPRVWGAEAGKLYREEVTGDADGAVISQDPISLETRDFYFTNPQMVKELHGIFIDASYGGNCTGIKVYLSARSYLNETASYSLVGTWTIGITEGRLTFPPVAGRIFRWKFEPVGSIVRNLVWSAFVQNVYDGQAVK